MTENNVPEQKSRYKISINGISIHSGIVIGKVFKKNIQLPRITDTTAADDPSAEWDKLTAALDKSREEITGLIETTSNSDGIFEAHLMILSDPELLKQVKALITRKKYAAHAAWIDVINQYKILWQRADSSGFMSNKSSDILDIAIRVLRHLGVRSDTEPVPDSEVILVVNDLSPSEAIKIDTRLIKGIICATGNQTSHSAILVKSLGIPAIFGAEGIMEKVADGEEIITDGSEGSIFAGCEPDFKSEMCKKRDLLLKKTAALSKDYSKACSTSDGTRIRLLANIAIPDHVPDARRFGSDGIGLFRTEFVYLNKDTPPGEEEQYEIYSKAVDQMQGKPVTFRTADFGGDKPIPYLGIAPEQNPFLGLRGIRYSLREPDLFITQLRAIFRASCVGPVSIMYPMVATISELLQANTIAEQVKSDLTEEGHDIGEVPLGIMIEVPSTVVQIDEFLKIADFVSIGTNDLAQYIMATDRLNPVVGEMASGCQPVLLTMIEQVISAANRSNKPVSICGEMAGEQRFTKVLLGFGLKDFSMGHDLIPEIKHNISRISLDEARMAGKHVLSLTSAEEVRKYLS